MRIFQSFSEHSSEQGITRYNSLQITANCIATIRCLQHYVKVIDRFGLGIGHLNFLAVPGVGISEFLFVPMTTNRFSGGKFSYI